LTEDTSREAFKFIQPEIGFRQKQILNSMLEDLYYDDFTAMELSHKLGRPRDVISPRLSELERKGWIINSQTRHCRVTGFRAKAWRPSPSFISN